VLAPLKAPSSTSIAAILQSLTLTIFGETKCAGLKHLVKLISSVSINRVLGLLSPILEILSPGHLNDRNSSSYFIDVISASLCYASKIAKPRFQRINLTLECLFIASTLEDAFMSFADRILLEYEQCLASPRIFSPTLKLYPQAMNLSDYKVWSWKEITRKAEDLSIAIKTIVSNHGAVILDFYYREDASDELLVSQLASKYDGDHPISFLHIQRQYKLTMLSSKRSNALPSFAPAISIMSPNLSLDPIALSATCVSAYPFESLAMGIFLSVEAAAQYRDIYLNHLSQTIPGGQPAPRRASVPVSQPLSSPLAAAATAADPAIPMDGNQMKAFELSLMRLLSKLSEISMNSYHGGDLLGCCDTLILIHAMITVESSRPSYCIMQAAAICTGTSCLLRIVIDTLSVLLQVIDSIVILIKSIDEDVSSSSSSNPVQDSVMVNYHAIFDAILHVKHLLVALFQELEISELHVLTSYLHHQLTLLFQKGSMAYPNLPRPLASTDLKLAIQPLTIIAKPLHRIITCLTMIEASVSMDILVSLIEYDLPLTASNILQNQTNKRFEYYELPRSMQDMFGYMNALVKNDSQWISVSLPSSFLSSIHQSIALPTACDPSSALLLYASMTPIDLYGYLVVNHPGYVPTVSIQSNLEVEIANNELPSCMPVEGLIFRYLVETRLVHAFQDVYFQAATQVSSMIYPYASLTKLLYPYASAMALYQRSIHHEDFTAELSSSQQKQEQQRYGCVSQLYGLHRLLAAIPRKNLSQVTMFARICPGIMESGSRYHASMPILPSSIDMRFHYGLTLNTALDVSSSSSSSSSSSRSSKQPISTELIQIEVLISAELADELETESSQQRYQTMIRRYFSLLVEQSYQHLHRHRYWLPQSLMLGSSDHYEIQSLLDSSDMRDAIRLIIDRLGRVAITGYVALPANLEAVDQVLAAEDSYGYLFSDHPNKLAVEAALESSPRCYHPCQINFTFLAQHPSGMLFPQPSERHKLDRLITKTIWFCAAAATDLWQLYDDEEVAGAVYQQAVEDQHRYEQLKDKASELRSMLIAARSYAILLHQQELSATIYRYQQNSYITAYSVILTAIQTIRVTALQLHHQNRILRETCTMLLSSLIRDILFSSQAVHLPGGLYLVYHRLMELESVLQIGYDASIGKIVSYSPISLNSAALRLLDSLEMMLEALFAAAATDFLTLLSDYESFQLPPIHRLSSSDSQLAYERALDQLCAGQQPVSVKTKEKEENRLNQASMLLVSKAAAVVKNRHRRSSMASSISSTAASEIASIPEAEHEDDDDDSDHEEDGTGFDHIPMVEEEGHDDDEEEDEKNKEVELQSSLPSLLSSSLPWIADPSPSAAIAEDKAFHSDEEDESSSSRKTIIQPLSLNLDNTGTVASEPQEAIISSGTKRPLPAQLIIDEDQDDSDDEAFSPSLPAHSHSSHRNYLDVDVAELEDDEGYQIIDGFAPIALSTTYINTSDPEDEDDDDDEDGDEESSDEDDS
jgi:hypothetical protein